MHGGAGRDTVYGGPGNDVINGGTGIDTIVASYGKDTIRSRDGVRDFIFCGPDFDKVIADRLDLVRGCEYVLRG
jgi:Ca2+-binding RTX toxin-like protein